MDSPMAVAPDRVRDGGNGREMTPSGRWRESRTMLLAKRDYMLYASVLIIVTAVMIAVTVPLWHIVAPAQQDLNIALTPPIFEKGGNWSHPLGTDYLGRDELSQLAWGTQISLLVGTLAVLLAAGVGAPLGIVATYRGGALEEVTMRVLDIVLAIPTLLMAIAVLAVFGASLPVLIIVLGLRSTVYFARTLRSRVLTVREEQYVKAAKAVGLPSWRIILRHVAPQTIAPLVVLSTIYVGLMIIVEASLSFLGLASVHVSWGFMAAENINYLSTAWWTELFPGIAILGVVFAFNIVGDFLRDILDPRLQPRLS